MAYPSVTYSFVAGQPAAAAQVNRNFTDIINGLSDGTKDLNVAAIACTSLTPSSALNVTGAMTCDGLRVDTTSPTNGIVLAVGNSVASSGTYTRDTTKLTNIVCDTGRLTDDGVLVIEDRPDNNDGILGFGFLGWTTEDTLTHYAINFTYTYSSASGTLTLTAAGPNTADFDDADTDDKMCLYIDTNNLVIKNRTGHAVKVTYWMISTMGANGS